MKIAFYGSSLLSSYWNGAATYYRGILKALARLGHEITLYEPDAYVRQAQRDFNPPGWARVTVYAASPQGVAQVAARAAEADVVVNAPGVGHEDDLLLERTMRAAAPHALRIFWDVDAPATLAELAAAPDHPLRRALPDLDMVLTHGGGDAVVDSYRRMGARDCLPVHNALDPETHFPVAPEPCFAGDLGFLGNRRPDREARVEEFFLRPAERLADRRFLLGGSGWDGRELPGNVVRLGHVGAGERNAFNCSMPAVLNISREDMAATGFLPATPVFEAAGAGACLITDARDGVDNFLQPGAEILVARDGADVAEILTGLTPTRAQEIGRAARARVLAEHSYDRRAEQVHGRLAQALEQGRIPAQ